MAVVDADEQLLTVVCRTALCVAVASSCHARSRHSKRFVLHIVSVFHDRVHLCPMVSRFGVKVTKVTCCTSGDDVTLVALSSGATLNMPRSIVTVSLVRSTRSATSRNATQNLESRTCCSGRRPCISLQPTANMPTAATRLSGSNWCKFCELFRSVSSYRRHRYHCRHQH